VTGQFVKQPPLHFVALPSENHPKNSFEFFGAWWRGTLRWICFGTKSLSFVWELDSGPISQNKKTPPSTGRCAARVFEKSTKSMIPHTLLYAAPLPGTSGYGDI